MALSSSFVQPLFQIESYHSSSDTSISIQLSRSPFHSSSHFLFSSKAVRTVDRAARQYTASNAILLIRDCYSLRSGMVVSKCPPCFTPVWVKEVRSVLASIPGRAFPFSLVEGSGVSATLLARRNRASTRPARDVPIM